MIEVGDRRPVACMHSNVVKKGMTKRQKLAGFDEVDPAITHSCVGLSKKRPGLAHPAASSPRYAATTVNAAAAATRATYTASAAAATSASSAAAATSAAAAPATPGQLYAALSRCCVFLVEQIERGQTDVGEFFFTEHRDRLARREVIRLNVRGRHGRCGCAPHQRKTQPGGPHRRYGGLGRTLPLRSLLHPWHSRILPYL
jgi:hypothetical protein